MTTKELLKNSYKGKKQKKQIGDFVRDDELSGERVQVYSNDKGKTKVIHRGTSSKKDLLNDLAVGSGFGKYTDRYKHSKKIQKAAEAKYGKDNIITLGHSLGGFMAENVTKGNRITANKAVPLNAAIFKKIDKNQTDIRNNIDPISAIGLFQSGGKQKKTVRNTLNPWKAHKLKYTLL